VVLENLIGQFLYSKAADSSAGAGAAAPAPGAAQPSGDAGKSEKK